MDRSWYRESSWLRGLVVAVLLALGSGCAAKQPVVPTWDPAAFRDLDTLEFLTVGPDEGPHWSTVWLVVLDDHVYVRLGARAAGRMERNTTKPYVRVRIGGKEYERVRTDDAAAVAGKVADAMAAKYTTDVFVRYMSHPMTLRLEPEPAAP
jgi:hypothetical protein